MDRGRGGAICCRDVAQPVMGAPLTGPPSWTSRPTARARCMPDPAGNSGEYRVRQEPFRAVNCRFVAGQRHVWRQFTGDSQAQSAGSIPVTRSIWKPQVSGLGLFCCLEHFQAACHSRAPTRLRAPAGEPPTHQRRPHHGLRLKSRDAFFVTCATPSWLVGKFAELNGGCPREPLPDPRRRVGGSWARHVLCRGRDFMRTGSCGNVEIHAR
jgi:hypothetical protein